MIVVTAADVYGHMNRIIRNIGIIESLDAAKYPNLTKIANRINHYLIDLNYYSKRHLASRRHPDEGFYFFASVRHLPRVFNHGKYNTWSRNINVFCALGLLRKIPASDINIEDMRERSSEERAKLAAKLGMKPDELKEIGYYVIPEYDDNRLMRAEQIAAKMNENGYKLGAFSKDFLADVFGQEFADNVYRDDRKTSQFSAQLRHKIEEFILYRIQEWGYTTRQDVIDGITVNVAATRNRASVIGREFDRCVHSVCTAYGLKYSRATKPLVERFHLGGYKTIIHRP